MNLKKVSYFVLLSSQTQAGVWKYSMVVCNSLDVKKEWKKPKIKTPTSALSELPISILWLLNILDSISDDVFINLENLRALDPDDPLIDLADGQTKLFRKNYAEAKTSLMKSKLRDLSYRKIVNHDNPLFLPPPSQLHPCHICKGHLNDFKFIFLIKFLLPIFVNFVGVLQVWRRTSLIHLPGSFLLIVMSSWEVLNQCTLPSKRVSKNILFIWLIK